MTCNHCASFHKETYQDLKKEFIDTGKVYFVYEEFPLNGPALYGSMIARCLPEERYAQFIDILLRQQDDWAFGGDFKAALKKNAKLLGMSDEDFDTCYGNKDLQKAIATNIREASDAWKINSTPSFVINDGERILYGGQDIEVFRKLYTQLTGESAEKTPMNKSLDTLKAKTMTTIDTLEETVGEPISEFNSEASNALDASVTSTIEKANDTMDKAATKLDDAGVTMENANKALETTGDEIDAAKQKIEESFGEVVNETENLADEVSE